jgi:hypothetical protein
MKRILVLDGGGVKGKSISSACAALERKTGKLIWEMFDLIIGTSVGAILGGLYASGKMPANEIDALLDRIIPQMFKRKLWPRYPMYQRQPFIDAWNRHAGYGITMQECRTMFICTSVDICDGRTHYFKSWEPRDGMLNLLHIVLRSFAAPMYFGEIDDPISKRVWLDGGTGNANCPLSEAIVEAVRWEWLGNEKVHILSLGTGFCPHKVSFREASRWRWLKQVAFFAQPKEGGLARAQMVRSQIEQADSLATAIENFSFQRVDYEISKKMDCIDGVKYMKDYSRGGERMAESINYRIIYLR